MEPAVVSPPAPPILPLASPEQDHPWLTPRQLDRWVLAFVILGLTARCVRYFLRFPLWEDECFLCVNLIDRDFRGLMQPLNYRQVAPLFFLWMQLAVTKLFGFNELSLRLVPFLSGLGSIVLFWRLARSCLDGVPRLLAVAVFSVTYATVRYSAEAKPYGVDLFVALVLITFTVKWWLAPGRTAWLWALAAAIPLAIGLSYGAAMLGGGLCLTVAFVIWRQRRWESLLPWAVYSVALLGSFAALYFLSIRGQEAHDLKAMREMWQEHFPPLTGVGDFAFWMLHQHTGDLLAYPAGGSPFQSSLSAVCWFVALIVLAWRRQGSFLVLCLAPLAVTFVAALLRRFPYGGAIRLNLYMAPFMCMLIGYGLTVVGVWWVRLGWRPGPSLTATLGLLALVGGITIARDLAGPYKNISDQQARAFAEWFWYNAEHEAEAACVKTDLGMDFSPDAYRELCFAAEYLCNRRIYSPRHAAGEPIHWDRVAADHPLRCVLYRATHYCFDEYALEAWLAEMQQTYDLVSHESYPMVRLKIMGSVVCVDYLEIFCFVPRGSSELGPPALSSRPLGQFIPPSPP
jgi:Dolichyl-phosphate-mannose-protein mannosyltransferase